VTQPPPLPPDLLAVLEAQLGTAAPEVTVLDGGVTNRNLRMGFGAGEYVVRLCGKETAALGIDREAEVQATRAAHALGIGPEVVAYLPEHECVVTRFVQGRAAQPGELSRRPGALEHAAGALRAFHAGASLPVGFDAFELGAGYCEQARARGAAVPDAYADATALVGRIAAALRHPEHAPVPCHNDLLSSNFLLGDQETMTIVDWEYAGMGDRYFDLGNLAVNNVLDEADGDRLLGAYWGEPPSERRRAALALMRIVSDYREATWGVIQGVLSELDFDYGAYADKHLTRLLHQAADPRLERWLDAAAA
jgi:aminoglycoside phosphotransferase (APT) family kinase protein